MATEEITNLSVGGLSYTTRISEVQRAVKVNGLTRSCVLVDARIVGDDIDGFIPDIPCFPCSGCVDSKSYFRSTRRTLFHSILSTYPSLPPSFADSVAIDFAMFVRATNAAHLCPHLHIGVEPTTITYAVDIHINQQPNNMLDIALRDSFEEAQQPITKPATAESVQDLVKARSIKMVHEGDLFENGWSPVDCTICMDTIHTRSEALPMPCCHEYHDDCLRTWLNTSNACPLCRYKLPC